VVALRFTTGYQLSSFPDDKKSRKRDQRSEIGAGTVGTSIGS
jgi:hypothetical protein